MFYNDMFGCKCVMCILFQLPIHDICVRADDFSRNNIATKTLYRGFDQPEL